MTFGSLFAGIEGFGLGLTKAGWRCVWQVEYDPHCNAVLREHFPDVERHSDVRRFARKRIPVRPDLICGGFPCQDLSVAGKRAGLAGKRSGLFFEFMRVVQMLAPCRVLIENVDGLRSSNSGRDMGTVLGTLGKLGYGWAYRVLDSQWFGLAQRRNRVFIVGCAGGDFRSAAKILFESDCLPWHPAPRSEKRERVAGTLESRTGGGGFPGTDGTCDGHVQAFNWQGGGTQTTLGWDEEKTGALHVGQTPAVVHTLRAEGHDASEDGTGRGVPLVATHTHTHTGPIARSQHGRLL